MLVAFWSAIAFCIGIILIYFSYLNYQKHKALQRKDSAASPAQTTPLALDIMTSQRRVSLWRTTPRAEISVAHEDERDAVLGRSPPPTDKRGTRHVSFADGDGSGQRHGGDASVDWSEEIW